MNKNEILKIMEKWSTDEIVNAHNILCTYNYCPDDKILKMEELDKALSEFSPREILNLTLCNEEFSIQDSYFWFINRWDGLKIFSGNHISCNEETGETYDLPISMTRLAEMFTDGFYESVFKENDYES